MNITHGLRRALQVNPDGLATVFGKRRRSWREIGDRVARLAAGFHVLGVKSGDRVAILSLNSDRYLEVYLATGWAGAVVVPLNIRWSPLENEDELPSPQSHSNELAFSELLKTDTDCPLQIRKDDTLKSATGGSYTTTVLCIVVSEQSFCNRMITL